jgi:serine/threonine protein kinase
VAPGYVPDVESREFALKILHIMDAYTPLTMDELQAFVVQETAVWASLPQHKNVARLFWSGVKDYTAPVRAELEGEFRALSGPRSVFVLSELYHKTLKTRLQEFRDRAGSAVGPGGVVRIMPSGLFYHYCRGMASAAAHLYRHRVLHLDFKLDTPTPPVERYGEESVRPFEPPGVSPGVVDLVRRMLRWDPAERPDLVEVINVLFSPDLM